MKHEDALIAVGTIAFIGGLLLACILPATNCTVNYTAKKQRPLNMDYIDVEQRCVNGVWMWHVYYDDSEFEYETSDSTLEAAMKSMRELVNM